MLVKNHLTLPKTCIDCKKKKPAKDFCIKTQYRTNKSSKRIKSFLLMSVCKTCNIKRVQNWQQENREKHLLYQIEYYLKNKKVCKNKN